MDEQITVADLLRLASQLGLSVAGRGQTFDIEASGWSGTYRNDALGLATAHEHLQRYSERSLVVNWVKSAQILR